MTRRRLVCGLGAEFAWACDLRVMADGDFIIGQPEVPFGIMPGGGGTQRLTRLIGAHQSLVAILAGKPFTPAEALANGAVDAVVPQGEVVARATELAEHFGSRSKGSVAAIKRAVYFGGSMSLSEGLHVERTEFLMAAQSKDGQDLMTDYLATTEATGELPLYNPDTYARALELGKVPGRRSTNGAVSRRARAPGRRVLHGGLLQRRGGRSLVSFPALLATGVTFTAEDDAREL